jgi:hypothetical protein
VGGGSDSTKTTVRNDCIPSSRLIVYWKLYWKRRPCGFYTDHLPRARSDTTYFSTTNRMLRWELQSLEFFDGAVPLTNMERTLSTKGRRINIPDNGPSPNLAACWCREDDFDVFDIRNASRRITFHHHEVRVFLTDIEPVLSWRPRKMAPCRHRPETAGRSGWFCGERKLPAAPRDTLMPS